MVECYPDLVRFRNVTAVIMISSSVIHAVASRVAAFDVIGVSSRRFGILTHGVRRKDFEVETIEAETTAAACRRAWPRHRSRPGSCHSRKETTTTGTARTGRTCW